ncbi:TerD family protein [bacterium]|nr:TerD family protein [bacterium]
MPISLVKGERINLTKENPGLQKLKIGLSWDMKPGLTADLDASILLLGDDGKMIREDSIVFYNQLTSFDGAVVHSGDNRTGDGDGDDEVISVDLKKTQSQEILAVITSYADPNQEAVVFGRIKNATVKLYDAETNEVLYVFDLTEDMSNATSMEMVRLYKHNGEWKFNAIGERVGSSKNGLEDVVNKYSK